MNDPRPRTSLWLEMMQSHPCPPAQGDLRTQVLVVGAGMTGLLTAARLADCGLDVVVVDAGRIASRNTGLSTGNLYAPVSNVADLVARWGGDVVSRVVQWRAQAIHAIELLVRRYDLRCGFDRVPMQYGVQGRDRQATLQFERELQAYTCAGMPCRHRQHGLPFTLGHAFTLEGQAQFDPAAFCAGLAMRLSGRVRIHEHTALTALDPEAGIASTRHGSIRADHFVLATHSPAGFNLVQAEMECYREYAVAAPVSGPPAAGIHWIADRHRSLRRATGPDGAPWLVMVGESHRVGETPATDPCAALEADLQHHFAVSGPSVSWSAQQFRPADRLPFIGNSAHDNVWIASGYGADGLTWAGVAAHAICEGIQGVQTDAARLFSPMRFTPLRSIAGWARCNATVAKHMIADRMRATHMRTANIAPGEGVVVQVGGDHLAVHRDDAGDVHVMSAVCPHLKCLVQWNGLERSWDCPCHGSRFSATGALLEGPARTGLEPRR
ncbi:FAD-dependent oxidoreductase [Stenotrophomonas maltophilia]|uniref:FAD-dependent oxidoreductase n=1 Tax=Stenotrophomonas maltophilia TaxID=40324 RepID=UPI0015DDAFC9|nr:FAD-dependent oxidoreductase [Stenotrophomonas maltophilia]MBA0223002.1 FAD-dependent oxidoreductase [Stenotrophomonas maltophilia]